MKRVEIETPGDYLGHWGDNSFANSLAADRASLRPYSERDPKMLKSEERQSPTEIAIRGGDKK